MSKFPFPIVPFSCLVSLKSLLRSDCCCCFISFSCICFNFFNLSNLDFSDDFVLDNFDLTLLDLLAWPLVVGERVSAIFSLLPFRTASNLAVDEILFSFSTMSVSTTLYLDHS